MQKLFFAKQTNIMLFKCMFPVFPLGKNEQEMVQANSEGAKSVMGVHTNNFLSASSLFCQRSSCHDYGDRIEIQNG